MTVATALPTELATGTWTIDPTHSEAAFTVRHAGISKVRGTVAITDGAVTVTDEGASSGNCQLKIEYVLERSMCSKKCSSDSDCKDGGPTKKVVVENTKGQTGFSCARIQTLGKFCCEKLCVCNDDLDLSTANDIQKECAAGTQEGCCVSPGDMNFMPAEACGKP